MFLRLANARVATGWVLFGHPHDELPNLLDHAGTFRPLAGIGPFPGDEVSVPPQGVRRHDRATWRSAARPRRCPTHREATSLIIRESQPSAAAIGHARRDSLPPVPDHVLRGRPLSQPARGGEEHLKKRNGTTGPVYSTDEARAPMGGGSGRVLGHYAVRLEGTAQDKRFARSPEDTGRTVSESASLSSRPRLLPPE